MRYRHGMGGIDFVVASRALARCGLHRVRCEVTRDDLDGGWIAECLDLPGAMSQGETQDEAINNLVDAITDIMDLRDLVDE